MEELLHSLLVLLNALGQLLWYILQWSLLIAWLAWWLLAVNWKRAWGVLAEGAWAPVVLLGVAAALVWSQLAPTSAPLPNFWWQLGVVAGLIGSALFCGWLQGVLDWAPGEISLEPPAPAAHHHGHDHP